MDLNKQGSNSHRVHSAACSQSLKRSSVENVIAATSLFWNLSNIQNEISTNIVIERMKQTTHDTHMLSYMNMIIFSAGLGTAGMLITFSWLLSFVWTSQVYTDCSALVHVVGQRHNYKSALYIHQALWILHSSPNAIATSNHDKFETASFRQAQQVS